MLCRGGRLSSRRHENYCRGICGRLLQQDIQVKEVETSRATLAMMVKEIPQELQGKTLICKIDNQSLKAVLERTGTSHNLALNQVGGKRNFLVNGHGTISFRLGVCSI